MALFILVLSLTSFTSPVFSDASEHIFTFNLATGKSEESPVWIGEEDHVLVRCVNISDAGRKWMLGVTVSNQGIIQRFDKLPIQDHKDPLLFKLSPFAAGDVVTLTFLEPNAADPKRPFTRYRHSFWVGKKKEFDLHYGFIGLEVMKKDETVDKRFKQSFLLQINIPPRIPSQVLGWGWKDLMHRFSPVLGATLKSERIYLGGLGFRVMSQLNFIGGIGVSESFHVSPFGGISINPELLSIILNALGLGGGGPQRPPS